MKIISLSNDTAGYACSVASAIRRKYNSCTNFFDYLVTDMNTIIQIISLSDLNLIKYGFSFENQNPGSKNVTMIWNRFSKLISYHDLKINFNETDYKNAVLKYIRRYFRLMNDIYNEDKIFFIRYGKTKYDEIKNFINKIKELNPNLEIYFVNADYDENLKENIHYQDINNYIYINFFHINKEQSKNEDIYFRILEYNWDFIFNIIENNTKY